MVRVYLLGDVLRVIRFADSVDVQPSSGGRRSDVSKDSDATNDRQDNNIARAKSTIRELGLCNPWEYFVTLTVRPSDSHSREDLGDLKRRWNQCVKDYNRKFESSLKYVLVPELHADGVSWHFHGFLMGVAPSSLVTNANGYLDIPYISRRIGFISLSPIRNLHRVSSYITKYITKGFGSGQEARKHLYIASVGLNRKQLLWQSPFSTWTDWKYSNDYVDISEYSATETLKVKIGDDIIETDWLSKIMTAVDHEKENDQLRQKYLTIRRQQNG